MGRDMPHFPYHEDDVPSFKAAGESLKVLRQLVTRAKQAKIPQAAEMEQELNELEERWRAHKQAFFPDV